MADSYRENGKTGSIILIDKNIPMKLWQLEWWCDEQISVISKNP